MYIRTHFVPISDGPVLTRFIKYGYAYHMRIDVVINNELIVRFLRLVSGLFLPVFDFFFFFCSSTVILYHTW